MRLRRTNRAMLSGVVLIAGVTATGVQESPTHETQPKTAQVTTTAGVLHNEDIMRLTKAGIDDATVIAKITTTKSQFETSTDALIVLKQSGVSSGVLKAMVLAATPQSAAPTGANSTAGSPSPPAQVSDLVVATGDLGLQTILSTSPKGAAALKQVSERTYIDFKIVRTKHNTPVKIGDLQVILVIANPKQQRYTIEVIADEKHIEKKDRTVGEPVQFLLSRAHQPYELFVSDIKKDMIVGYLSTPKPSR